MGNWSELILQRQGGRCQATGQRGRGQRAEAGAAADAGAEAGARSCGVFFPFATTTCYSRNELHVSEGVSDWMT